MIDSHLLMSWDTTDGGVFTTLVMNFVVALGCSRLAPPKKLSLTWNKCPKKTNRKIFLKKIKKLG